jgi:replicative DNA helicase
MVPPSLALIRTESDSDSIEYLDDLFKEADFLKGPDFEKIFKVVHSSYYRKFIGTKVERILSGEETEDEHLLGNITQVFMGEAMGLSETRSLSGSVDLIKNRYEVGKEDPHIGILTGIDRIDMATRGHKLGELWLYAAFISQGKSTVLLREAYEAVITGYNLFFVSLEMMEWQLWLALACIHSMHPKWEGIGNQLIYKEIQYSELSPEDEQFLFEVVLKDLKDNPNYGEFFLMAPQSANTTLSDVYREMLETEAKFEVTIDKLSIDYVKLLKFAGASANMDQAMQQNHNLRGMKLLAMTYQGRGLAVSTAFQTNRDGHDHAMEKGFYLIKGLSESNEAERSADVIIFIFLDDTLKAARQIRLQQAKNRDGEVMVEETWLCSFIKESRYVGNLRDDNLEFDDVLDLDV